MIGRKRQKGHSSIKELDNHERGQRPGGETQGDHRDAVKYEAKGQNEARWHRTWDDFLTLSTPGCGACKVKIIVRVSLPRELGHPSGVLGCGEMLMRTSGVHLGEGI